MSDLENVEIEALSDDDLESVAGGAEEAPTTGGTCTSAGNCQTGAGKCETSGGTCQTATGSCNTTGGSCQGSFA